MGEGGERESCVRGGGEADLVSGPPTLTLTGRGLSCSCETARDVFLTGKDGEYCTSCDHALSTKMDVLFFECMEHIFYVIYVLNTCK